MARLNNSSISFIDSTPHVDSWAMCSVCYQPNPAGQRFCQHCWGAIIHEDAPILSSHQMKEALSKKLAYLKRRKTIKLTAISLTCLIILTAIVYPTLYFATNVLFKPPEDLNSNSLPGEWAMFRHDMEHSGSADSTGILPQGKLKWAFPTGGAIHSSPAVANGTVYFGSQDNKLYAVDADTGTKLWEFETGSWIESSPAIANGVVYFGSNDGNLYALDATTGAKLWEFETPYPIMSSPAVAGNMVYFGADDYTIYALNALDGTMLWYFYAKSHITSSPVVLNGIVYIGGHGTYFYSLHSLDGRRILRFKSHYPGFSSAAINDDTLYFTNSNGYLYAVDANARSYPREFEIKPLWSQLWVWGLPLVPQPPTQSGFLWQLRLGKGLTSSPVIAGETLYIGSDKNIFAIDIQEQKRVWQFKTGGLIRSSPAVVDGRIYVGSGDGRLYAVDAETGQKVWEFLTEDEITSSPAVANGTVYIGSYDGNLYAIE